MLVEFHNGTKKEIIVPELGFMVHETEDEVYLIFPDGRIIMKKEEYQQLNINKDK
jgi:hypothetical protein